AEPLVRRVAGRRIPEIHTFADQRLADLLPVLSGGGHLQLVAAEDPLAVAGPALRGENLSVVDLAEPQAELEPTQPAIRRVPVDIAQVVILHRAELQAG